MTPEQRIEKMSGAKYMGYVARLGCILCARDGYPDIQAQVHHPRKHGGLRRLLDKHTIPLCEPHHSGPNSVHMARRHVEERYGISEEQMSAQTRLDVIALIRQSVGFA